MKWSKHLKIAGALQIAQALMTLVFSTLYIIILIGELQEGSQALDDRMLILAPLLLVGVCQLWFGISLMMQKRWTSGIWGIMCCVPGLVTFPIPVSAYALWVVIMVRGEGAKVTEPIN